MGRCEGRVIRRVPVLRENDVLKERRDVTNRRDDFIAVRNNQRSAGTEIILHVNDDQNVVGADSHFKLLAQNSRARSFSRS